MKTLSKITLAVFLLAAPILSGSLSSCTQSDGKDPLMKTTRLNEAPDSPRKEVNKKEAPKKEKPKVQSFQTNYTIAI